MADGGAQATASKTVTDTVSGEHTHTIVGYSLVKGIGDGEPVASDRFTVGGHEWVLLFYPDGKRSSAELAHHAQQAQLVQQAAGAFQGADIVMVDPNGAAAEPNQANHPAPNYLLEHRRVQRDMRSHAMNEENEYAALFVALIGEGGNPQQGVLNTSEGKVVRAFHKFTLVNQTGAEANFTKGRARDAGAVKISCARQDPNARNCHGYRKFIKRAVLEDPAKGYLVNDTIIIKYSIELVVTNGGALNKCLGVPGVRSDLINVPPPRLGTELADLFRTGQDSDITIVSEDETSFPVHKIILESRSPVFRALLNNSFKEGSEGIVHIKEIKTPVLKVLLHFVYSDALPDDMGDTMDCAFAQHLLEAADRFELNRLRKICEKRLCLTIDQDTVATTLTLAEQNRADDLKKVCLDYVAKNLLAVLETEGYKHMLESCPTLQGDIIQTVASLSSDVRPGRQHQFRLHNREAIEEAGRRVRQRRAE